MTVPTFYAFTNPESHAFFLWLTDHSGIDVADLVARAMGDVERDSDYALFGDVSRSCRAALARRLGDTLRDRCADAVGHYPDDPPDLGRSGSTLVAHLLAFAVGRVDTESVAEAILRLHRKWSPDDSVPEAE